MQSSSLSLKHSDISTATTESASSPAGYWSNSKGDTTWNVDLRTLIGAEVFDKHKRFILRLNMVAHNAMTYPATNADMALIVQMSGLNWVNSSYNALTGVNSNTYDAFLMYMESATARTYYLSSNISKAQFQKSSTNVQIRIQLIRQFDGLPAQNGIESFPSMVYSFDIFPVDE